MAGLLAGRRADVLAVGGVAAVGTVLVAVVDPGEPGSYPTCPFLAITGWWCPFCGGLRTTHALAHVDLAGALGQNPVLAVGLPILGIVWVYWAWREFSGRSWTPRIPAAAWWGLGALLAVFTVLRNLPGMEALAPS